MLNLNFNNQNQNNGAFANTNFKEICDNYIRTFPVNYYQEHYRSLMSGTAVLNNPGQLHTYMACYADMHRHKLNLAFDTLFTKENFSNKTAEIIDWGCGQAFASGVLIDYVKNKNIQLDLDKFILIEPSKIALERGIEHIDAIYQRIPRPKTYLVNDKADADIKLKDFVESGKIKIHLFSNLLDLAALDLDKVVGNIKNNFDGINYFVCVSPLNEMKLRDFYSRFPNSELITARREYVQSDIFRPSEMKRITRQIARVEYIFKTHI